MKQNKNHLRWARLLPVILLAACKPHPKPIAFAPIPTGWVDWNTPDRVDSLARRCAQTSHRVNQVSTQAEQLQIATGSDQHPIFKIRVDPLPFDFFPKGQGGARLVEPLKDGWLIGFSNGEWGGSLWRANKDGSVKKRLLNENVRRILPLGSGIFVFTDTSGSGFRGGGIYRLSREGQIEARIDLEDAPSEFVLESTGDFYIVGISDVFRVGMDLKNAEKLNHTELYDFFPNSITRSTDGSIYIGLNFFLLRLIPTNGGYREQWLVPATCNQFHIARDSSDCLCDGP